MNKVVTVIFSFNFVPRSNNVSSLYFKKQSCKVFGGLVYDFIWTDNDPILCYFCRF